MCYNPNEVIHMGMEILTDNSAVLEDIAARKSVIELENALAVEREERRNSESRSDRKANLALLIAAASLVLQIVSLIAGK